MVSRSSNGLLDEGEVTCNNSLISKTLSKLKMIEYLSALGYTARRTTNLLFTLYLRGISRRP